jgi:hypothetical protein
MSNSWWLKTQGSIDDLESVKLKLIHPAFFLFGHRYVVLKMNRV